MNNVTITVNKTIQSSTTPVVELEYIVNIQAKSFGVEGVFDSKDENLNTLIHLLENYAKLNFISQSKPIPPPSRILKEYEAPRR